MLLRHRGNHLNGGVAGFPGALFVELGNDFEKKPEPAYSGWEAGKGSQISAEKPKLHTKTKALRPAKLYCKFGSTEQR